MQSLLTIYCIPQVYIFVKGASLIAQLGLLLSLMLLGLLTSQVSSMSTVTEAPSPVKDADPNQTDERSLIQASSGVGEYTANSTSPTLDPRYFPPV